MDETSPDTPSPAEQARRKAWFDGYTARLNARPRQLPLELTHHD